MTNYRENIRISIYTYGFSKYLSCQFFSDKINLACGFLVDYLALSSLPRYTLDMTRMFTNLEYPLNLFGTNNKYNTSFQTVCILTFYKLLSWWLKIMFYVVTSRTKSPTYTHRLKKRIRIQIARTYSTRGDYVKKLCKKFLMFCNVSLLIWSAETIVKYINCHVFNY